MNNSQKGLTEQEIMKDLLLSEKHGTSICTSGITESSCTNLRQVLSQCEQNIFKSQEDVFNAMNKRGWYPTKKADSTDVQNAKNKYSKMQNELS